MIRPEEIAARPEAVGVDSEKLEALFARVRRDVDEGGLPSAQVAVGRNGRIAGMRTFGRAVQGGQERPATDSTLYCVYSCTKVVVAAAVWLLIERGLLRTDERVAEIIPEFGSNRKDRITVEQVMLHTGGFPYAPFAPGHWGDREALVQAFARWRLNWEPDSRWEYHATSAHWVLVEIIHRRAGQDYKTFIREQITGPLGLPDLHVGLPEEEQGRVADVCHVGEPVPPPGGWKEVTPDAVLAFNQPFVRSSGLPGGGAIASAADLALFYQALVNRGQTAAGRQVLKPETIEMATAVRTLPRHTEPVIGIPVNRGLSIVVAGGDGNAHLRGFGRVASPRAFGHSGAGGQIAWGDPATGISLGYCTNGFVDWLVEWKRTSAISSLAAACAL